MKRVLALLLVSSGCGLVSGLDSLGVGDASTSDVTSTDEDAQATDAPSDTTSESSALDAAVPDGRAGYALRDIGSCATGAATLSLSGQSFAVEVWLSLTASNLGSNIAGVVWSGGRTTSEPGWSIDLTSGGVIFCTSSTATIGCTQPYVITPGDLVHLVATSTVANSRTIALYERNVSKNESTHTLVSTVTTAPPSWSTSSPLTVGGTTGVGGNCANTISAFVDDVRVFDNVPSIAEMDNDESSDICTTDKQNLLADFKFDEGTGTTTGSCVTSNTLTLKQGATFAPSPFP
jgi:hypothetical protein